MFYRIYSIYKILTSAYSFKQKKNAVLNIIENKRIHLYSKPMIISIVTTPRCNMNCDMCATHSNIIPNDYQYRQDTKNDMTFLQFKKVLDLFPESLSVQLIGAGEPLLNNDIFLMIDYAASNNMRVKMASNGLIIKKYISKLINSKLYSISISLNGFDKNDYHRLTGMPSTFFEKIQLAIKQLLLHRNSNKPKLRVYISFIIDKINYIKINDMIHQGLNLGVDKIVIFNYLPSFHPGFTLKERTISSEDFEIINFIKRVYNKLNSTIKKRVMFPKIIDFSFTENHCQTYWRQIRVDGDDNISSCSIMCAKMSGHGKFYDANVWNNQFFQKNRSKFLLNDKKVLDEPCKICPENVGKNITDFF